MTETTMNRNTLIEKAPDADLLRVIGVAVERPMELVDALTDAAYGEKNPERISLVGAMVHAEVLARDEFAFCVDMRAKAAGTGSDQCNFNPRSENGL